MELEQGRKPENSFEHNKANDFYDEILSFPDEKQYNKWSVSWADLMMTMFIFFAVMYIYQVGDKNIKFGYGDVQNTLSDQGSGQVANINALNNPLDVFDKTRQAVKDVMIDEKITVDMVNDNAVRIVLAGDFLFDLGRARLKLGAKYQLDQIAKVLNENEYMINVGGHTDDSPTNSEAYPTNWELSSQRAVMVARYLIEVCNVDEERIFITAHSYHQPVRPNDTAYNRSLNRRVELILSNQKY